MPAMKEKKIYRTFILSTSLVVVLILAGIFIDMVVRTRDFANEENVVRARAVFKTIALARQWNALHGGVYVEKRKGVESNPLFDRPDIRTGDGRVLTLRNHALMTREISEYAEKEGDFKFRITSLNPLNARNAPDAFETSALTRFTREGLREAYATELIDGRTYFRYMAPLLVERECLRCHRKQGETPGAVRGGISVRFDIEGVKSALRRNTMIIAVFGVVTTVLLLGLIWWFAAQLMKKLAEARMQIEKIAITDDLTGVYNRRHIMNRFTEEFEQARRLKGNLSCIIADIDHFKTVNDLYGHLAGDEVLKATGQAFKSLVRAYDIVGRYGGEEFLFILPETSIEQAWHFAERVRMHVKERPMADRQITISLGATGREDDDQSIDDMIKRADDALYRAKNAGRDRVEWTPDQD